jgi:ATP-binding cassette subfamily B protein
MKEIRYLLKLVHSNFSTILTLYISKLGYISISLLYPILLATLVDQVFVNYNLSAFFPLLGIAAIMTIQNLIFYQLDLLSWQRIVNSSLLQLKYKLFSKIILARPSYLSNSNSGELIQVINGDVQVLIDIINQNLLRFINSFLSLVFIFILVCSNNFILSIMILVLSVFSIFLTRIFGNKIEKIKSSNRQQYGEYVGFLSEVLNSLNEIRLFGNNNFIKKVFMKSNKKFIQNSIHTTKLEFLTTLSYDFLKLCSRLSLYVICAIQIMNNTMTIGFFIAIVAYYEKFERSLQDVINLIISFKSRKVHIHKIQSLLDIEQENYYIGQNKQKELSANVKYDKIQFSYDQKTEVLKELDLIIQPGENLAIIGKNGAGKSTLGYLLMRYFDPQKGNIILDNYNIQNLSLKYLRKNIGFVQQTPMFFEGTLRDNLKINKQTASDEEIWSVLKKVDMKLIIEELPDKLDTFITFDGPKLSGGQKQRLSIVRVILGDYLVLILDEITSSIDYISESIIGKKLFQLENKAIIVITHKFSTAIMCEKIAILQDGRIKSYITKEYFIENQDKFNAYFK